MRSKLQKFTDFANTLLPHETAYLLRIQQFQDDERLAILQKVDYNCRNILQFEPYDESIDKRKYSHLKNWIVERLEAIDVDVKFNWMSELERKIMTDSILPTEEKRLLKVIRNYRPPSFFFTKMYELAERYQPFLLIRMRYADYRLVNRFLEKYQQAYHRSKSIEKKMHQATLDIVEQYAENTAESKLWEDWLTEVFYDKDLDGLNRYLALVRLIFIGFNYRKFDTLLEKFDYLDNLFKEGKYYSKRLLLNYYSNRLLLHSKFKQLDQAVYYGYLSIRAKNHDFLFYSNNLCAILLRQNKAEAALKVIKGAATEAKTTKNLHNKITHVAFYIESLNKNRRFRSAENYAKSFLTAYKKEIFEYRWHIFFTAYLDALLHQKKYHQLIRVIRQNKLLEKEKAYQSRANYLPTIFWYHAVAAYKEHLIDESTLQSRLSQFTGDIDQDESKFSLVVDLLHQLHPFIPKTVNLVFDKIKVKSN